MGICFEEPYPGPYEHKVTPTLSHHASATALNFGAIVRQVMEASVEKYSAAFQRLVEVYGGMHIEPSVEERIPHQIPITSAQRQRIYPSSDPSRSRSGRRRR